MFELTDTVMENISGGFSINYTPKWKYFIYNSNSSNISIIGNKIN